MNDEIKFCQNCSTTDDIFIHLKLCDAQFVPYLSSKVILKEYSEKLFNKAVRFEAWNKTTLIGLVAAYLNPVDSFLYITNVSVTPDYQGKSIAKQLLLSSILFTKENNLNFIELEVNKNSINAINLYKKLNFENLKEDSESCFLIYKIRRNEQ
ncbi:ribosomal protein S18 acetylase RimI-like enzyme [Flavobacterium sp. CG_23.5]|uniref:GNAT family N-acetyltransferase n=1 Tax=Flavobacterium sp. CG_23.5 TaxID=2760708 RepID=UPI001AE91962|nr:N-acetyltransferase [Flavobacterium sp. CG_23.5]MBP2283051.1 ribosomal protein S18 acetylase RimI-like enzyme [Flavobacterium sp. CG_23.5]